MAASAPRRKKPDVKALLAGAKLVERSVDLCLRGDLVAQMQDLQRQLVEAEAHEQAGGSLDGGQARLLAEKLLAVRAEMAEHTIVVKLRALPRRQWAKLVAEHPPREDNETDRVTGLNGETFWDALLRACMVEPTFDEDDWQLLEDVLSDAQWQSLNNTAWAVNAKEVEVPFSQRAWRIVESSAQS